MLKKTITYTDFNGVERTEDFYFNLTKAELAEMEMGTKGGMAEKIQSIVKAEDVKSIIDIFKGIILQSYGEKTEDGRRFMKVDENGKPLNIAFSQTEAYSALFMELATDTDKATEFINGLIPVDIARQISREEMDKEVTRLLGNK